MQIVTMQDVERELAEVGEVSKALGAIKRAHDKLDERKDDLSKATAAALKPIIDNPAVTAVSERGQKLRGIKRNFDALVELDSASNGKAK